MGIQAKGLHYGGQLTAINHCLYWNKVQRTGWTFFGDVDEFMAVTDSHTLSVDLIKTILGFAGTPDHQRRVAAFAFHEYNVDSIDPDTSLSWHERLRFDPSRRPKRLKPCRPKTPRRRSRPGYMTAAAVA